jgi:hypothetical protein
MNHKQNMNWKELANAESKEGWWDFFHNTEEESICLAMFHYDKPIGEIKMNYEQWKDLYELVNRITNR